MKRGVTMALTGTSYSILSELFANDKSAILNSMSIQQLVENTSISQGAVYKSVDMLLGTGYIAEGAWFCKYILYNIRWY